MRVIYMGKSPSSVDGLKYLIEKNIKVVVVVALAENQPVFWQEKLSTAARRYGLPIATDNELYDTLGKEKKSDPRCKYSLENIDLVISLGFWKRIKKPLIELPRIGCINFHPAPLPDFRGMGGTYNFAIYEGLPYWGVSAHFVDESFDTGDLIKVLKFNIDPEKETAFSLRQKSHEFLIRLFKEVIDLVCETDTLPRIPQGEGRYVSKQDFEKLRKINPFDTLEEINRKIRALWCPPFGGAFIKIRGEEFTLVNERILKEIGEKYWKKV